jgi:hypothetical protein
MAAELQFLRSIKGRTRRGRKISRVRESKVKHLGR